MQLPLHPPIQLNKKEAACADVMHPEREMMAMVYMWVLVLLLVGNSPGCVQRAQKTANADEATTVIVEYAFRAVAWPAVAGWASLNALMVADWGWDKPGPMNPKSPPVITTQPVKGEVDACK